MSTEDPDEEITADEELEEWKAIMETMMAMVSMAGVKIIVLAMMTTASLQTEENLTTESMLRRLEGYSAGCILYLGMSRCLQLFVIVLLQSSPPVSCSNAGK